MFCLLLMSLWMGEFSFSYDQMSDGFRAKVFQVGDHYVVVGKKGHELYRLNQTGQTTHAYTRSGQGPKELFYPWILGVHADKVLCVSNRKQVLAFNADLVPDDRAVPALPADLAAGAMVYGINAGPDTIWLLHTAFSNQNHLVTEMVLTDGAWRQTAAYLQRPPAETGLSHMEQKARRLMVTSHNGHIFKTRVTGSQADDTYQVSVYNRASLPRGEEVMVLVGDISEPAPIKGGVTLMSEQTLKTQTGYTVLFRAKNDDLNGEPFALFADHFDHQGTFIQRRKLPNEVYPCINGPEIFELVEDAEGDRFLKRSQDKFLQPERRGSGS
ncbi:hypothetical protein [Acanthopleuribacter pedis]|uniref:Uncharacterized protein n=1 Tax=Acanthopleuribacter pedis TaxID=442870 RepID=A0A8J7QQX2_9BACT|nr:hypothetical protein [Acanthopleuribacter pedis]MBO1322808.1 hypothetical protein [Acanthopleuribacter pedis]